LAVRGEVDGSVFDSVEIAVFARERVLIKHNAGKEDDCSMISFFSTSANIRQVKERIPARVTT
jgi:hypothetical protein